MGDGGTSPRGTGMDVYFCDICGVRVTDVDLRGGHGMRRGHDVICAGCLDLGHGKDWMDHHRAMVPPAPAAQSGEAHGHAAAVPVIPATMAVSSFALESPTLDAARDRARTLDEDLPAPEAVMAQPVAVSAPGEFESDTDRTAPIQAEPELPSSPAAPAVSALEQTAATRMASSGNSAPAPRHAESDELDSVPADASAVAIVAKTLPPARPGKPTTTKTGKRTSSDQVPAAKSASGANAAGKKGKGDDTGKRSGTEPTRPVSSVKPKTGRVGTAKRKKSSNTGMLLAISGLSLAIILVGGIGLAVNKGKASQGAVSGAITDRLAELKTALAAAKASGLAALNSKDHAQLEAANRQLIDLNGKAIAFETEAKKQGLTEAQVGEYLENIQFSYTRSLSKNIRDEIAKQAMQH